LLDQVKLEQKRLWWQLKNLMAPILLLGLLGGIMELLVQEH
jgi:hypothetical protein